MVRYRDSYKTTVLILSFACLILAILASRAKSEEIAFLAPVRAALEVEKHPKAGVDIHRDAHDFNTDAVRIAEAQYLTGKAWVKWVLRWNREQYQRAQRDLRIETRSGTRIQKQGSTITITPWVSRSSYGSGPALLFNPFVQPQPPITIPEAP